MKNGAVLVGPDYTRVGVANWKRYKVIFIFNPCKHATWLIHLCEFAKNCAYLLGKETIIIIRKQCLPSMIKLPLEQNSVVFVVVLFRYNTGPYLSLALSHFNHIK